MESCETFEISCAVARRCDLDHRFAENETENVEADLTREGHQAERTNLLDVVLGIEVLE